MTGPTGSAAPGPGEPAAVVITECPGGPLLVRGPVRLVDAAGRTVDPGRPTFALCRCGATRTPPFCDGTHKLRRAGPGKDRDPAPPNAPTGRRSGG